VSKVLTIKKILYYFLMVLCALIVFIKFMNLNEKLPFGLWYVHSDSMQPEIKTDDGYILIRSKEYTLNDIITFKPQVLKDKYITHRIIDITDDGKFITKGDYNVSTDQEGGEPPIGIEQIVGKVLVINEKPIVIPHLGTISRKINEIVEGFNIFKLLSLGIIVYLIAYILDTFADRHKTSKKKKLRLLDIAPYFDWVFLVLCITMFINIIFLGLTIKSWGNQEVDYVVVTTKGISSPLPGEVFTETMGLVNNTFFPFVTVMEPMRIEVEVNPEKLKLPPKQHQEYILTIKAPEEIGYYIDKIKKRTYPDILPDKFLDYLYSKSEVLPLIVIFSPGILLSTGLYIWWVRRWQDGKRVAMKWLIPLRRVLGKLSLIPF